MPIVDRPIFRIGHLPDEIRIREIAPPRFLKVLSKLGSSIRRLLYEGVKEEQILDPIYQRMFEEELWYRGDLSYLHKEGAQEDAINFTMKWKEQHPEECGPIIWNLHRGSGKSHGGFLLEIQRCLRFPGHIARFASPTNRQTLDFAIPILKTILDECPDELRPSKSHNTYTFKNPRWENKKAVSYLVLCGCKEMAAAKRGPRSDTVFLDEGRDIEDLEYIVESVFAPHFISRTQETGGPLMVLSSTPPDYADHPYWTKFSTPAESEGRYILRNVLQNPSFTKADEKMLLGICKSKKSTAWRREAMCEQVSDEARMIIPELENEETRNNLIVEDWPRPKWYRPHMSADFGLMDNSAMIWGYLNWPQDGTDQKCLIIEDECVVHYKSIGELATLLKTKEEELYSKSPFKDSNGNPIIRRFADNDALVLQSFRRDHGIAIGVADKWDLEAGVALLRTNIQEGRIKIHSRCRILLKQLKNGLLNERGKIERSKDQEIGHCDAIMALVYLNKTLNWNECPVPFQPITDSRVWVNRQPVDQGANSIKVTRDPLIVYNRGTN